MKDMTTRRVNIPATDTISLEVLAAQPDASVAIRKLLHLVATNIGVDTDIAFTDLNLSISTPAKDTDHADS